MTYKGLQERSIATVVLLSFLTCGIYVIYLIAKINDEVNSANNEEGTSGLMVNVFMIITCGIYTFFWFYKMGEKLERLESSSNVRSSNDAVLFIVLTIFGMSWISLIFMQSKLNNIILNNQN